MNKKNAISKVNLVLFLCSFALCSANSFSSLSTAGSNGHFTKQISERHGALLDDSSQQTSEKNETENEDCFELQALALPFFFSYFPIEIAQFSFVTVKPPVKELSSPIYISVCNFRV